MADRRDPRSATPARLLAVGLAALAAVLVTALAGWTVSHLHDDRADRSRQTSRATGPRPTMSTALATGPEHQARALESRALRALREWDQQRATAYAAGSTARLRRLYVPGSRAGAADLDLLQHYLGRGFHVHGMRTQVLAVSVLEHRAGRWRVRVTDRLVGAVATSGGARVRLPQGRGGEHVLTLVPGHGHWQMASARRAPRVVG